MKDVLSKLNRPFAALALGLSVATVATTQASGYTKAVVINKGSN
jgi:hypothetical protein